MNTTPKTIQIFLPGGDPRGIRVAEITTRIVQVIEVPRSLLAGFLKMPESTLVALYFLFGEAEDGSGPKVYIGQTGDLRARLVNHHKEKDFWERALILISRTNSLTQTHTLFLEWHCLQAAKATGRYANENGNAGSKPHTPPPLAADCLEIFETGQILLATLGFPIFTALAKLDARPWSGSAQADSIVAPPTEAAPATATAAPIATATSNPDERYFCKAEGVDGEGIYTSEGFVVLKGSIGRRANMQGLSGHSYEQLRRKLVETGVVEEKGDAIVFTKDYLFTKPSPAAVALMGRPANGWLEWKSKDNRTLDAMKRQNVN